MNQSQFSNEQFDNSFYIDAKDKSSGNLNNFNIKKPSKINFRGLEIKKVSMAWNVYNVQAGNGVFNILYNGNPFTITLTAGNYDANSLLTQLKTQLQAVDVSFNVTYNTITSKYTITAALAFSFLLATNNSVNKRVARLLGFDNINTVSGTSLTSTYPINIIFTQYFDIVSNELLRWGQSSDLSNKKLSKVLKRVYVNDVVPFGNINIIYDVPRRFEFSPFTQFNDEIDISIYDDQSELLDVNGASLSMQIDVSK